MENKKPDNPNVFPIDGENAHSALKQGYTGMTLRDYFAAKAMQGIVNTTFSPNGWLNGSAEFSAQKSYQIADAMLKEREK